MGIAGELENPFGNDANDLPLLQIQKSFNDSLGRLLDPRLLEPPNFAFDKETLTSWDVPCTPYRHVADALVGKSKMVRSRTASLYEGTQRYRRELTLEDIIDADKEKAHDRRPAEADKEVVRPLLNALPSAMMAPDAMPAPRSKSLTGTLTQASTVTPGAPSQGFAPTQSLTGGPSQGLGPTERYNIGRTESKMRTEFPQQSYDMDRRETAPNMMNTESSPQSASNMSRMAPPMAMGHADTLPARQANPDAANRFKAVATGVSVAARPKKKSRAFKPPENQ